MGRKTTQLGLIASPNNTWENVDKHQRKSRSALNVISKLLRGLSAALLLTFIL